MGKSLELTSEKKVSFPIPVNREALFECALLAIRKLKRIRIVHSDKISWSIYVDVGISWWSWGERVAITFQASGPNNAIVHFVSRLKVPTGDIFEKNAKNIKAILFSVLKELENKYYTNELITKKTSAFIAEEVEFDELKVTDLDIL